MGGRAPGGGAGAAAGPAPPPQAEARGVFVHHAVRDYAVRLVMGTRDPLRWGMPELASQVALGASPRATLGLLSAGRALALLRGRRFLVPQDVYDVVPEVLRHRLLLTYDALAGGVKVDQVIDHLLATIEAPRVAPHQDDAAGRGARQGEAAGAYAIPAAEYLAGGMDEAG